jgi:anti-sigma-K factor RskA
MAGSVAAGLAAFIAAAAIDPRLLPRLAAPQPPPTAGTSRFVAVIQRDAAAPAFVLTVDLEQRTLTLRRVGAEQEPGKSYELWLVSTRFPAPRSLGVVGRGDFTQSDNLAPYDSATIGDATFAVSLEPEGGSPTGQPSNVMFLGKLIEATPPVATRPP